MYTLNEKIRDLEPYEPIAGEYKIRLDANESFLCLPESVMASALHAITDSGRHRNDSFVP